MPTQWTLSLNPLPPSRTANTSACVGLHLLGALRLRRPRWALTPPASTRALARRGCPSLDGLQTAVLPPSVLTETVLGPPNRGFRHAQRVFAALWSFAILSGLGFRTACGLGHDRVRINAPGSAPEGPEVLPDFGSSPVLSERSF